MSEILDRVRALTPAEVIRLDSPAAKRVMEAGFTFLRPQLREMESSWGLFAVDFPFRCVCGKVEQFRRVYSEEFLTDHWELAFPVDIGAEIERHGAVSVEHLREDGYSEEEIARIRRPYEQESHT